MIVWLVVIKLRKSSRLRSEPVQTCLNRDRFLHNELQKKNIQVIGSKRVIKTLLSQTLIRTLHASCALPMTQPSV